MKKARNIISMFGAYLLIFGIINLISRVFFSPSILLIIIISIITMIFVKKYFVPPFSNV